MINDHQFEEHNPKQQKYNNDMIVLNYHTFADTTQRQWLFYGGGRDARSSVGALWRLGDDNNQGSRLIVISVLIQFCTTIKGNPFSCLYSAACEYKLFFKFCHNVAWLLLVLFVLFFLRRREFAGQGLFKCGILNI